MYLHPNLISTADTSNVRYLSDLDRQDARERSLEAMQMIVLNEIQQGEPQTCAAFADFCAERLEHDALFGLCLSHINRDAALRTLSSEWVRQHVEKCRPLFVAEDVERRIDEAGRAALAEAMARQELDHV